MKTIGVGNTAKVLEYDEGLVLKLFNEGYPLASIEKEFNNARLFAGTGVSYARAHKIIDHSSCCGIVYDYIKGMSLEEWLLSTMRFKKGVRMMVDLHRSILAIDGRRASSYKEFLSYYAKQSGDRVLSEMIDALPNGTRLLHGDFHPNNILVNDLKCYTIDYMNLCYGPMLYDIARTVYLTAMTPLPDQIENQEEINDLRHLLMDNYLMEMGVRRDDLTPFLNVIHGVRRYECPHEFEK